MFSRFFIFFLLATVAFGENSLEESTPTTTVTEENGSDVTVANDKLLNNTNGTTTDQDNYKIIDDQSTEQEADLQPSSHFKCYVCSSNGSFTSDVISKDPCYTINDKSREFRQSCPTDKGCMSIITKSKSTLPVTELLKEQEKL